MFDLSLIEKSIKDKFSYLPHLTPNMTVTNEHLTLLIDSKLDNDMFNIIYSTGEESKKSIDDSINYFRKKDLSFCWWVGFETDPDWLRDFLSTHGLNSVENEMLMAATLKTVKWPKKDEHLLIKKGIDRKGLNDFLLVMKHIVHLNEMTSIDAFYELSSKHILKDNSGIELFIGYFNNIPVATCSVYYSQKIASIFDVIVTPNMRGRGFGKKMTAFGVQRAAEKGYDTFALTATNNAKHLYEKLGFSSLKLINVYS